MPANLPPEAIWLFSGIALLIFELFAPGIIIVFFGAGALITSLTTWFGLTESFFSQSMVFVVSSLILLFTLRKTLRKLFVGDSTTACENHDEDYIGREARVIRPISSPSGDGQIEIKGAVWKARADEPIAAGSTVIITRREGLTFHVTPFRPSSL